MPSRFEQINPRWKMAAAVLFLTVIVSLSGIRSWPDQIKGMRPGNRYENFDRFIAQELDEPELCEKISWNALLPGGVFLAPSYERSECYEFIAGRTKNPKLCWKVKRYGSFSLLSLQTSVWSCLNHAIHGWNGGVGIHPDELTGFFAEMGYDPDTLQLEGITPPIVSVQDIYRQLPKQSDIVTQIEKAAGDSAKSASVSSSGVEDAAYLDDLAALVTRDPHWCLRIPEGLRVGRGPHPFRDWCLFKLATTTRDAELCRRIRIPPELRDARTSLEATCVFQVHSTYPNNTVYAPEVPVGDDQTRRLITRLNYEIPHAKSLPAEQIYQAYYRFLLELENPRALDSAHVKARRRLLERARRLPNHS